MDETAYLNEQPVDTTSDNLNILRRHDVHVISTTKNGIVLCLDTNLRCFVSRDHDQENSFQVRKEVIRQEDKSFIKQALHVKDSDCRLVSESCVCYS